MSSDHYKSAGVDYTTLDSFKRMCQRHAAGTAASWPLHDMTESKVSRGDSAFVIETSNEYLAHVEEGLGTKNLIADEMERATGKTFYHAIGIDTVAAIVNDIVTCGALPITVAMHAAVGDAAWFDNLVRAESLIKGFAEGCRTAGAIWGGGETPALKGIVTPGTIVLAGSAVGRVFPKSNLVTGDVQPGDAIVFLKSSGVHANGLSLCRSISNTLPKGFSTILENGRSFGEELLIPSHIYAPFIRKCQDINMQILYSVNMTGHGWRKLLRLPQSFCYRITNVPDIPLLFRFLIDSAGLSLEQAYATFNMGVGFAVFIRPDDVKNCIQAAKDCGFEGLVGGYVEQAEGIAELKIEPHEISFDADSLAIRS